MAKKPVSRDRYEDLGRALAEIAENSMKPGSAFYKAAFLRGLITGFGGVIGATLLVALLAWILSLFDAVPFVDTIRNTIREQ